ncbi:MAG: hypothetical protein OJF50_002370 [Nitrospira sp.]|nr:hypothetical protein [Nitrospira sp.]
MIVKRQVKRSNYINALEFLSRKHPSLYRSSLFLLHKERSNLMPRRGQKDARKCQYLCSSL